MAKVILLLAVLCALVSLAMSSADPTPAKYEEKKEKYPMKPEYKKMEDEDKYEKKMEYKPMKREYKKMEDEDKYEKKMEDEDKYEKKMEYKPMKREYKKMEDEDKYEKKKEYKPMKSQYKKKYGGGKKYKRSIEDLDFDPEEVEDSTDVRRRWLSSEEDDVPPRGRVWSEDDLDDMMDEAPQSSWWSPEEMDEIMDDPLGGRYTYTKADELMDAIQMGRRRPAIFRRGRRCFRLFGRRICIGRRV